MGYIGGNAVPEDDREGERDEAAPTGAAAQQWFPVNRSRASSGGRVVPPTGRLGDLAQVDALFDGPHARDPQFDCGAPVQWRTEDRDASLDASSDVDESGDSATPHQSAASHASHAPAGFDGAAARTRYPTLDAALSGRAWLVPRQQPRLPEWLRRIAEEAPIAVGLPPQRDLEQEAPSHATRGVLRLLLASPEAGDGDDDQDGPAGDDDLIVPPSVPPPNAAAPHHVTPPLMRPVATLSDGWEIVAHPIRRPRVGCARPFSLPASAAQEAAAQEAAAQEAAAHAFSAHELSAHEPSPYGLSSYWLFGGGVGSDALCALRRRHEQEQAMAYISHLAAPASQPLLRPFSLTALALRAPGYACVAGAWVRTDGLALGAPAKVPPYVLLMLQPQTRNVYWSESFLSHATSMTPEQIARTLTLPSGSFDAYGWEAVVEPSPALRFLLAFAWVRWYAWRELTAEALGCGEWAIDGHPLVRDAAWSPHAWHGAGFSHVDAVRERWEGAQGARQARYAAKLWHLATALLAPAHTLDAHTARYLGLASPLDVPPLEAHKPRRAQRARFVAVAEHARRLQLPDGREPHKAWARYVDYLARAANVPPTVVRSRLDGDWLLDDVETYVQVTHELLLDLPDLALWREGVARELRLAAGDLAFCLVEPLSALSPLAPHALRQTPKLATPNGEGDNASTAQQRRRWWPFGR